MLPAFTADSGWQVKPLAVGSGQAIELGRRGEADVLLVHSPEAELKFGSVEYFTCVDERNRADLTEPARLQPTASRRTAGQRDGRRQPIAAPMNGDDTFDLVDDALTTLARRRGLWLGDGLTAMALVASLIELAERCLPQRVHDARANGHTWREIALALGTSPGDAQLSR